MRLVNGLYPILCFINPKNLVLVITNSPTQTQFGLNRHQLMMKLSCIDMTVANICPFLERWTEKANRLVPESRRQSRADVDADQVGRVRPGWIPSYREAQNRDGEQSQMPTTNQPALGPSTRGTSCPTCSDSIGITDRLIRSLRQLQFEMTLISNRTAGRLRNSVSGLRRYHINHY